MQMRLPFGAAAPPAASAEQARPEASPAEPASTPDERARGVACLGAELEAALVRELRSSYAQLNASFFKRKLVAPSIELSDAASRLGRWIAESRTIEISRPLVLEQPWGVVIEVLKHEMAHQ